MHMRTQSRAAVGEQRPRDASLFTRSSQGHTQEREQMQNYVLQCTFEHKLGQP